MRTHHQLLDISIKLMSRAVRDRCFKSNGQSRVHPEARWPKQGIPFNAGPRAPSYWPTPAQTRLWPNLKRVHPILATHPPIGYPISITPTRLWRAIRPAAHTRTRHRVIAGRGGSFLRSMWSCVRQNFNLVVQSVCDAPINTSYQKLPFGSGDYPHELLFHQALN